MDSIDGLVELLDIAIRVAVLGDVARVVAHEDLADLGLPRAPAKRAYPVD